MLPSDYSSTVSNGLRALRAVGGRLRQIAEHEIQSSESWLTIRDVEGLSSRLAAVDDWYWRHGFANELLTGQDLGVLDELSRNNTDANVTPMQLTGGERLAITQLREFLRLYLDGCFDFDSLSR